MSGNTYGDFPGVTVTTNGNVQQMKDLGMMKTDDDAIGTTIPGIRLWGHRIILNGESGIKCEECEMEEEIPDLLQMTNGFREVVYKMYILGKFKNTRCEPEFETDQSVLNHDVTNIGYNPNKVHWTDTTTKNGRSLDQSVSQYVPQNTRIALGGEEWEHDGHGHWHSHDSGTIMSSGEMRNKFGDRFDMTLGGSMAGATTSHHSIGDVSMGGGIDKDAGAPPSKTVGTGGVDVDADLSEEEKDSLKDKFVSALSQGKTTLR